MQSRVIVILPSLPDPEPIATLRRRFDPMADRLPPHISLVFPFESTLPAQQLQAHVQQAVRGFDSFPLRLRGITGSEGRYLFLNVKRGNDQLIELHDRLYTGPLWRHLSLAHTFVPHLTVGWLPDPEALRQALIVANSTDIQIDSRVTAVCVYDVAALDRAGLLESEVPLPSRD